MTFAVVEEYGTFNVYKIDGPAPELIASAYTETDAKTITRLLNGR